jgi:hypothetical protein
VPPIFLFYLIAVYFIARGSAVPRKTILWMVATLFVTFVVFLGLGLLLPFARSREGIEQAAEHLGALGIQIAMLGSVAVGFRHMRSNKRSIPLGAGRSRASQLYEQAQLQGTPADRRKEAVRRALRQILGTAILVCIPLGLLLESALKMEEPAAFEFALLICIPVAVVLWRLYKLLRFVLAV